MVEGFVNYEKRGKGLGVEQINSSSKREIGIGEEIRYIHREREM